LPQAFPKGRSYQLPVPFLASRPRRDALAILNAWSYRAADQNLQRAAVRKLTVSEFVMLGWGSALSQTEISSMKKTYRGGCHCGAVRFEADIDLSAGTFKCNCTICTKTRFWPAIVTPEDFRLLAGESELTEYRFNTRKNLHLFCKHCGVRSFGIGDLPEAGGKIYGVNVMCLDDVDINELMSAPVTYVDGRNDRWQVPPAEIRHL
jgi:hypothetical protein